MQMRPQWEVSQPEPSFIDRKKSGGKDVVRWARSVAPLGAMAIVLLGAVETARAGYWEFEGYTGNGKTYFPPASSFGYNDRPPYREEEDWSQVSIHSGYPSAQSSKPSTTITMRGAGGGKATFKWHAVDGRGNPDPIGSPAPASLSVKIRFFARAQARNSINSNSSGAATNSVENAQTQASAGDTVAEEETWLENGGQDRHSRSQVSSILLKQYVTDAEGVVEVPIPSMAMMASATSGPADYSSTATVDIYAFGYVAEDPRKVEIHSSTIEESLKKGTRPANRPDLAADQQPNVRKADGSIVTDSAAQWYETSDGSFKGWLGGGIFTSPVIGISDPRYQWSVLDEQPYRSHGGEASQNFNLSPSPATVFSSWYGIQLGNKPDGSDLLASSVVKVHAKDPSDDAVAENTFAINWHTPYENWQFVGLEELEPQKLQGRTDTGATSTGPDGRLVYDYSDLIGIEYPNEGTSGGLSTASAVIGAGTAGATAVYGVAGATPPTMPFALLSLLGRGLTLTAELADGTPGSSARELPTDYARYKGDLELQRDHGGYSNGTKSFEGTAITLNLLISNFKEDASADIYWQQQNPGHISVIGYVLRNITKKKYLGDHFNGHGYAGVAPANIIDYGPPTPHMVWTVGTVTPDPGGTPEGG